MSSPESERDSPLTDNLDSEEMRIAHNERIFAEEHEASEAARRNILERSPEESAVIRTTLKARDTAAEAQRAAIRKELEKNLVSSSEIRGQVEGNFETQFPRPQVSFEGIYMKQTSQAPRPVVFEGVYGKRFSNTVSSQAGPENETNGQKVYFNKVSIKDVNDFIEEMYTQEQTVLSTSLDILAIYLKCQKILYTEAKVYCEQQLNALMLPAIMISAFCTVLSQALQNDSHGPLLISILTAVNSFVLALISYLKLDAKAEAHKTSAYQFDKLQSLAEFNSGKVMFFNKDVSTISNVQVDVETPPEKSGTTRSAVFALVDEIENKVKETKEMNKFILPEIIRYRYNYIYTQNIFSTIKTVQTMEMALKSQLQTAFNDLNEAGAKEQIAIYSNDITQIDIASEKVRFLKEARNTILGKIIQLRDDYMKEDKLITDELEQNRARVEKAWCNCLRWLKT
jgi:hypothetical protein